MAPTIVDNIARWFRAAGHGEMEDFLTIRRIEPDRIWAWPSRRLRDLVRGWDQDPGSSEEFWHGKGSVSYREPGGRMPALQIVFHDDKNTVEIDFDYASPLSKHWFVHVFIEIPANFLWRQKTNQRKVAKLLDQRFKQPPEKVIA